MPKPSDRRMGNPAGSGSEPEPKPHWLVNDNAFGVGTIMTDAAESYKQKGSQGRAITNVERVELQKKIDDAKESGKYTDAGVLKGGRKTRRRKLRRRRHTRHV